MRTLINFVATGDEAAALCPLAIDSLMLQGFDGDVRVYTDRSPAFRYARPIVMPVTLTSETAKERTAEAKRLKVQAMVDCSGYDTVALCDVDILFSGSIRHILARVVDGKIHATHATSRNLVTCLLRKIWTPEQMQQFAGWPMIDTYFLAMATTPANVALLSAWRDTFDPTAAALGYASDAHAFNRALIDTDRFGDVVVIPEAERLNGKPKPSTIIHHYITGQHTRMPSLFRLYGEEVFARSLQ